MGEDPHSKQTREFNIPLLFATSSPILTSQETDTNADEENAIHFAEDTLDGDRHTELEAQNRPRPERHVCLAYPGELSCPPILL
jgi:hypothetical protein